MRYLAFDMGTKKIGVAYSDESGVFAFPEAVVPNDAGLFTMIFSLCQKYTPDAFVVGYSDSGADRVNPVQKHIARFSRELESRFGLPVHSMNESGTSQAVRRLNSVMVGQKHTQATKHTVVGNDVVDAQAAALILQRYLDQVNAKV